MYRLNYTSKIMPADAIDTGEFISGKGTTVGIDSSEKLDYSVYVTSYGAKVIPKIKKVIFNPPATIVMWADGTKTIAKASNESFSEEVGLCEAIAKRYFGNRSKLRKAIKYAKRPEAGRK